MKFKYICQNCQAEYDASEVRYLCPICSQENDEKSPPKGVLKCEFDYTSIASMDIEELIEDDFFALLPIQNKENLPSLKVGKTPLYSFPYELNGESIGLLIKDDSQNPSYSFKDRASAMVSAFAKEHKIQKIVAASTGNAGSSLACIAANQGQEAIVMVPEAAPLAKLTQIMLYGAKIIPVKGTYDDAFDLSVKATEKFGWYNRNTAFNPITIEGKKTVAFELWQQMGYTIPEVIFVPVGDGVIISGVYKGFEDLLKIGLVDRIPKIIAVQAEGSANIVDNRFKINPVFLESKTLADSIAVDIPRNYYMAKDYLYKYAGGGVKVSDELILEAIKELASTFGLFVEPAAATAFAGMKQYFESNEITQNAMILLTGSGLKDVSTAQKVVELPDSIAPNISDLEKILYS